VLGPNAARHYSNSNGEFPFGEHKKNIVASLNDAAKALMDVGIVGVRRPHTGMVIEKLDEVFAVLDSMDTKYVNFGPDVGQMVKGGAAPQAVTKLVKTIGRARSGSETFHWESRRVRTCSPDLAKRWAA
jgi:inosose dehydratase